MTFEEHFKYIDLFEKRIRSLAAWSEPVGFDYREFVEWKDAAKHAVWYTLVDMGNSKEVGCQDAPRILARLSFNDPEFIKALPDFAFATKKTYLDPVTNEPRSFYERFLSEFEDVFQIYSNEWINDRDGYKELCSRTKICIGLINERFAKVGLESKKLNSEESLERLFNPSAASRPMINDLK